MATDDASSEFAIVISAAHVNSRVSSRFMRKTGVLQGSSARPTGNLILPMGQVGTDLMLAAA